MSQQQIMSGPCFVPGPLLLPQKGVSVQQWACPSAEQWARQPEVWNELEAMKQHAPTAANMLLPDAFLFKVETAERIRKVLHNMKKQAAQLTQQIDGYIYLERTLPDDSIRPGLVGLLDLEQYSFESGANTLVRSPVPLAARQVLPRLELRQNAKLESSHILLAAEDEHNALFCLLEQQKNQLELVYSGELCYGGGSVCGWAVQDAMLIRQIADIVQTWQDKNRFAKRWADVQPGEPIALVPIAGNEELAAAKAHWMLCKEELSEEEQAIHPARFRLVEVCNLYQEALHLQPVHRVVMGVQGLPLLGEFRKWCEHQATALAQPNDGQCIRFVYGNWQQDLWLKSEKWSLAAGMLDAFLAEYLQWNPMCSVDYIAEEAEVRELAADGTTGLLLPAFDKSDLFRGLAKGGFLPRSPFVMKVPQEHRYELECRRIDCP